MKYLVLVTLLLTSFSLQARASEQITYIDFVLMDQEQKREVIKMLQSYSAQSEYIQNYVMKKNMKKKKRTSYVDFFFNQFKAYAGTNQHDEPERKTCFYGGWLSHVYVNKSNTRQNDGVRYGVCGNPARLSNKLGIDRNDEGQRANENIFNNEYVNDDTKFNEQTKAIATQSGEYYDELQQEIITADTVVNKVKVSEDDMGFFELSIEPYTSDGSVDHNDDSKCSPPKDIICNPMIYGRHNGGLFCVPKITKGSYNTSFLCEKALDSLEEADYNRALDAAVSSAQQKPELFSNTLVNMYDTCICKATAYENYTDSEYANDVHNTRTCVAIINSSRNILRKIGESGSCSSFERSSLGEVGNMSLFFNRAYNHLNRVANGLAPFDVGLTNTVLKSRSEQNAERENIARIADPLYESLRLNERNDDPDTQVCPISMEEIKEGQIALSGAPNLTDRFETVTVSYKIDGQIVDLNPGDVALSLVNPIDGVALGEKVDNGNNVTFTVPLLISQNIRVNVVVNKDGTNDDDVHFVGGPAISCNFTSEVTSTGETQINPTNSLSIQNRSDIDALSDIEMTYEIQIAGGDKTAFSPGSAVDLRGGNTDVKLFGKTDDMSEAIECNGQVIAGDELSLTAQLGEVDATTLRMPITVKLMNGGEDLPINFGAQREGSSVIEVVSVPEGLTGFIDGFEAGDDNKVIVFQGRTYHDNDYQIKFKTTYEGQEVESQPVTIPKQAISCVLSNYSNNANELGVFLEVKVGDSYIDPTYTAGDRMSVAISYGDISFAKAPGNNADPNKFEYKAQGTPAEESNLAGTISLAAFNANDISCSTPTIDRDEDEDVVASCSINISESGDGDNLKLSASISFKESADAQAISIESADQLTELGGSVTWSKSTESAPDNTEETVDSGTPERNVASAGSGLEIDIERANSNVIYTASVEGIGAECSQTKEVAKKETTTPDIDETPTTVTPRTFDVDNSGVNWQGPQAPGPTPRRRRRGMMFRGNR